MPETSAEGKQQEMGLLWKAEYVLQQYYAVTVNEQLIEEKWLSSFAVESRAYAQQEAVRFKRMLGGIVADRRALHAVCDYLVLAEQDSMGDEATSYLAEHYEGEKSFVDILVEQAHCFALEDRAWLFSLADRRDEEDFDLDLQLEGLRVAFYLKASGFRVGQHACMLEEVE